MFNAGRSVFLTRPAHCFLKRLADACEGLLQVGITRHEFPVRVNDAAIIRMRRRLMQAAEALERDGTTPPGADDPSLYRSHGEQALAGEDAGDWKQAYAALMAAQYP